MTESRRRLAGPIAATAALLAVTAALWLHIPTKVQSWAPIPVNATVGERAAGRDLALTVHRVGLAREVATTHDGTAKRLPASGVWLVIALTYEGLRSVDPVPVFTVTADGRTFTHYLNSLDSFQLVGVPEHGVIAFELPDVPRAAVLTAANRVLDKYRNELDAPLDSRITVPLGLSGVAVDDRVDLDEWAAA